MRFKYKDYGAGLIRPVIPVEIQYKDEKFKTEMLIDSGADFCVCNIEIGEMLGIDVKKGQAGKMQGVTGHDELTWEHEVAVIVGGHEMIVPMAFAEKAGFWGYQILGERGFFSQFNVKFNWWKARIDVTPARVEASH